MNSARQLADPVVVASPQKAASGPQDASTPLRLVAAVEPQEPRIAALPPLWVPTGRIAMSLYAIASIGSPLRSGTSPDGRLRYSWSWRNDAGTLTLPPGAEGAMEALKRAHRNPRALLELVAVVATALEYQGAWHYERVLEYLGQGGSRPGKSQRTPLRDWVTLLTEGQFEFSGIPAMPVFDKDYDGLFPTELGDRLNDGKETRTKGRRKKEDGEPPAPRMTRHGILVPGDMLFIRPTPNPDSNAVTGAERARLRLAATFYIQWRPNRQRVKLSDFLSTWAGLDQRRHSDALWFTAAEDELRDRGAYGLEAVERKDPLDQSLLKLGPGWRAERTTSRRNLVAKGRK